VAAVACELSAVESGPRAVPALAGRRRLGTGKPNTAPDGPFGARAEGRAHPGGAGFAIGQDGAKRGARGYDAGKKIKGRKRHIAVDSQGNLLTVVVHAASLRDRVAARAVLLRLFRQVRTIQAVIADGGYTGKLIEWTKQMFGWRMEIVKRNELHRFVVLPKRWVVERTFAWLNWSRRLSKDYELRPTSAETMIHIAYANLMLRRLA
jgi:transposase